MPTVGNVFTGEIARTDLDVLERWADPSQLIEFGEERLGSFVSLRSKGQLNGEVRAAAWIRAAREAIDLYGDSDAVPFDDIAADISSQVRLLRAAQAELKAHAEAREAAYRACDPEGLARSVPGVCSSPAARSLSPRSGGRDGSGTRPRSSPTPGSHPKPPRPAISTAKANRCRGPAPTGSSPS